MSLFTRAKGALSRVAAHVRSAVKGALPDPIANDKQPARKDIPQAVRLFALYQATKRRFPKRRIGMSAKSPEIGRVHRAKRRAGKKVSKPRYAPAIGRNSYAEYDAVVRDLIEMGETKPSRQARRQLGWHRKEQTA